MAIFNHPSPEVRRYCEQHGFSTLVCEGGFSYLLDCWTKTVTQVENGYRAIFDEYLNDMDTRQIIDELGTYASDEEWAEVEAMLPSLDDRFRAATRPVEMCIWGDQIANSRGYGVDRNWWYFRLPMNLDRVRDREIWPSP